MTFYFRRMENVWCREIQEKDERNNEERVREREKEKFYRLSLVLLSL